MKMRFWRGWKTRGWPPIEDCTTHCGQPHLDRPRSAQHAAIDMNTFDGFLGADGEVDALMQTSTQRSGVIALDADGVLLDYSLGYADVWEKVFGTRPAEVCSQAYWPADRWGVERLDGDRLHSFRAGFDDAFWSNLPAIFGALEACQMLVGFGFELVCVTALPSEFAASRKTNLQRLNLPIERVYTVKHSDGEVSPKAELLNALKPVAFVDDYLPYMAGVDSSIHRALIDRDPVGSPNMGIDRSSVSSVHGSLLQFSRAWCQPSI